MSNKLYDNFHKQTSVQPSVINERNYTYHIILSVLKKYLSKDKKILDIGCGSGVISLYLAKNTKNKVFGIDISKKAIQACIQSANLLSLKNVEYMTMDFPRDIPKGKFDIVLCLEVIEHLRDDKIAIERMFQMLKRNGLLVLSTPSINAPLHRLGYAVNFDKRVGHLRRYGEKHLINLFNSAGFKIIEIKKTEGVLRNFLFINTYAGKLIRFIKFPLSVPVNIIDDIFLTLFGESDIFVIAQKP